MRLLSISLLALTLSSAIAVAQQTAAPASGASSVPQQTVKVSELPPLSVNKDWTDQAYWGFTLFLAIVGGFQAWLLWGNLRAIERQAVQMERQTGILQQSVALAEKNAETARQNIELFVNRERAHLRVELVPMDWPLRQGAHDLRYKVVLHGATEAYVTSSCARAELSESAEPERDAQWTPPMSIPQVITPDGRVVEAQMHGIYPKMTLDPTDVDAVEAGRKFLHLRGFVKYNDVFGTERVTRFHRVWHITKLPDGTVSARWAKCGSTKENSET